MIKRKFRENKQSEYIKGKLIQLPNQKPHNDSFIIKKDENQNFPRIFRVSSMQKLESCESLKSRSQSRNKIIRDSIIKYFKKDNKTYTPKSKVKLNQSLGRQNSNQSSNKLHNCLKHLLNKSNIIGNFSLSNQKEKAKTIQSEVSPHNKQLTNKFKSLSKLVNYDNNMKNLTQNNVRNRFGYHLPQEYRQNSQNKEITNQSILKIQQLQNPPVIRNSFSQQHIQRSQNKRLISGTQSPMQFNGIQSNLTLKSQVSNLQSGLLTNCSNGNSTPINKVWIGVSYTQEQQNNQIYGSTSIQA